MEKIDRSYIRTMRYAVQWTVFAMTLYGGVSFFFFVRALEQGMLPSVSRSPSVEGFMPIGALMAFKLWITEGIFDPVHPAALVLFIAALLLAVLLKKSFCSWICPAGTLSEAVGKAGSRIFGRNFALHRYIDYPLRSLKYVLMLFFLYVILLTMSPFQIGMFLSTPYWKVADIKLLRFFTDMSLTTQVTLVILFGLSFVYRNFWCRYLCPYGGLLGLLSTLSPVKIRRTPARCIQCGSCTRSCPSLLPVASKETVRSPECTGCLTCVSACPAPGALDAGVPRRRVLRPGYMAAAVVVLFFGAIALAHLTGAWHSSVSPGELMQLLPFLDRLEHP